MRTAVQVQREVAGDRPLHPRLTMEGNLPHVTVFQGPFADTLEPERELAGVRGLVRLPREIGLAFTGVVYQPTGWVFLSLERPPLLEKLQDAVLAVLSPHLDRAAIDTAKDVARFTTAERASFARYGYRYTGPAYAPHMTLGRTEEDVAREIVRTAAERSPVPAHWVFDRMSFYVMGEHGAHARKLTETPLDPA
jgi:hypothetical protein